MKKNLFLTLFTFVTLLSFGKASASTVLGTTENTKYTAKLLDLPQVYGTTTASYDIYFNTPNPYQVTISDTELTGYLWGPLVGYISLSCQNTSSCGTASFKVTNQDGVLSGYAWGENAGWISFNCNNGESNNCASNNNAHVEITNTGEFIGYAWSQNFGWIQFDCGVLGACVKTDWRKPSLRQDTVVSTTTGSSLIKSSGGGFALLGGAAITESQNNNQNTQETSPKKDGMATPKVTGGTKTPSNRDSSPTCLGASCLGNSPFIFPISNIAPSESQLKMRNNQLSQKNSSSPTLIIKDNPAPNALSFVKEPTSIFTKVSTKINSLFTKGSQPSQKTIKQEDVTESPKKEFSLKDFFQGLFHR